MAKTVKRNRKKEKNLRWTPEQREIAALFKQGKSYTEVVEAGHTRTLTTKVRKALDRGWEPKDWGEQPAGESLELPAKTPPPKKPLPRDYSGPPESAFETKYHIDTSQPVTVGQIQVLPEDWRISQYGVFLILDTYHRTKEEIGYDGSVGKFMVDVFRFYRMIMKFDIPVEVGPPVLDQPGKEVSDNGDNRGEEARGGIGILEEGGGIGIEEAEREPGY